MNEAIQVLSLSEPSILQCQIVTIFEQVEMMIQGILTREAALDHGYAQLGSLLVQVSEQELWREAGFKSFDKYMEQLSEKYHRGRTMLYIYFSSVREMRPYLSETQMNEIGISKLNVLKGATKKLGFPPNSDVIEVALDAKSTVSDVKKKIAQTHQLVEEEQQGTWFELGGFFVTEEEKLVLKEAFEAAWRTDPVIQKTVKEQIRLKEGLMRFAMEYLAAHQDAVEEGVA